MSKIMDYLSMGASTYKNKDYDYELSKLFLKPNQEETFLNAYNSLSRGIEEGLNNNRADVMDYHLDEAIDMMNALLDIKDKDTALFDKLYTMWNDKVNAYLEELTGVRFNKGSILLKMFYGDLLNTYYMNYIDYIEVFHDNTMVPHFLDEKNRHCGFLPKEPSYNAIRDLLKIYIPIDLFQDKDDIYEGFTYEIYQRFVVPFNDNGKFFQMMQEHFSLFDLPKIEEGRQMALEAITNCGINMDLELKEEDAPADVGYSHLKIFYLITGNDIFLKKLKKEYKVSLFTKKITRK